MYCEQFAQLTTFYIYLNSTILAIYSGLTFLIAHRLNWKLDPLAKINIVMFMLLIGSKNICNIECFLSQDRDMDS